MANKVAARPARKSFSRLKHTLELPNLIDIQKASFRWFMEEGLHETIEGNRRLAQELDAIAQLFATEMLKAGKETHRSRRT